MDCLRFETPANVTTLVWLCGQVFAIRWIDGVCCYRRVGK